MHAARPSWRSIRTARETTGCKGAVPPDRNRFFPRPPTKPTRSKPTTCRSRRQTIDVWELRQVMEGEFARA